MSVNWRATESGTFVIIERQGLVGKFFGGFMLCISGCFLYWLGTAIVEYIRFGTLRDVIVALPGMAVTLFMAALLGVPGVLMGFLKKQTLCSKANGLIRLVKSFVLFRLIREVNISDVKLVVSKYRTTKRSNFNRSGSGTPVPTVEIVLADKNKMEVAQLENWAAAIELGQQLAGYLGVEFREGTA